MLQWWQLSNLGLAGKKKQCTWCEQHSLFLAQHEVRLWAEHLQGVKNTSADGFFLHPPCTFSSEVPRSSPETSRLLPSTGSSVNSAVPRQCQWKNKQNKNKKQQQQNKTNNNNNDRWNTTRNRWQGGVDSSSVH